MATDEELLQLAQQAQSGTDNPAIAPVTTPAIAPVIGTPEGPAQGIIPPQDSPIGATGGEGAMGAPAASIVAPGATAVAPTPPVPVPGIDTRAINQARQSSTDLAQTEANKRPLIEDKANAEADAQQGLSDQQKNDAIEAQAEIQSQKDGLAQARRVADRASEDVKNFKFADFWHTRRGENGEIRPTTTGEKIRANIGYALGAYAAGGSSGNGHNMAAEKIKGIVDQDFAQQREMLHSAENIASYRERGVTDLQAQYKDDIANLGLRQGLALKATADEAKAYLIRQSVPLKEAENNELVAKIRNEGDNVYAKNFQELVKDKAQLAMEKFKAGAAYAAVGENRREHDLQHEDREAALAVKGNKNDALVVRDPITGEELGYAPSARNVQHITDQAAASAAYDESLKAYLADIRQNGHILNPSGIIGVDSDDAKRRKQLQADVVARGRKAMDLGVSDANLQLEHSVVGGTGVGLHKGSSEEQIQHLIEENQKVSRQRLRSVLRPLDGGKGSAISPDGSNVPSAVKIQALKGQDKKDAIEASAALLNPEKADKARLFLKSLGVL